MREPAIATRLVNSLKKMAVEGIFIDKALKSAIELKTQQANILFAMEEKDLQNISHYWIGFTDGSCLEFNRWSKQGFVLCGYDGCQSTAYHHQD